MGLVHILSIIIGGLMSVFFAIFGISAKRTQNKADKLKKEELKKEKNLFETYKKIDNTPDTRSDNDILKNPTRKGGL